MKKETHARATWLAIMVALSCDAHALYAKTCGEIEPDGNWVAINSPGAQKPTQANSKAVASEKAKQAKYLTCTSSLLGTSTQADTGTGRSAFDAKALAAIHDGTPSRLIVAKAIYLHHLTSTGAKISGMNEPTRQWQLNQARNWCLKNDKSVDGSTAIPLNLPSLEDGVDELNPDAVRHSWEIISRYTTQVLKASCDDSLRQFLTRTTAH